MIRSVPTLREYARAYCLQRELAQGSVSQIFFTLGHLERYSGHQLLVSELSDELVNLFLEQLQAEGRSPFTRRSKRATILCVWRAAAEDGHVEPPGKVRVVKKPDRVIRAYTTRDMKRLLEAARIQRGQLPKIGIARRVWWESFLLTYWDTALRVSDLLRIERGWIDWSGVVELVQKKTSNARRAQLRPETIEAIDRTMSQGEPRAVIWPLWGRREALYATFARLRCEAGLPPDSSSKWIRRGSASAIEAVAPGTAWKHLGHSAPGLDREAYLDRSICDPPPRLPPPIG